MANANTPIGLKPVRNLNASNWNGATNTYFIAQGDAAGYAIGDVVISTTTSDLTTGTPGVTLFGTRGAASTSGVPRGVIVGIGVKGGNSGGQGVVMADPDALGTVIIPASKTKDYFVQVCDDPHTIFEAQADTFAAANFNKNCPLYVAALPTAPVFNSLSYAQGSAANTTQAFPLKIVGAPNRQDNDLTSPGTYARIYVMFNQHELGGPNTAGV